MNPIKRIKNFFSAPQRAKLYAQQLDDIDAVIQDGTTRGGIAKAVLKNDREGLILYLIAQLDRIDEISKTSRSKSL